MGWSSVLEGSTASVGSLLWDRSSSTAAHPGASATTLKLWAKAQAERLIDQGASVTAVQAQLGHASATVTLDHYGHLFPDELQRFADRLRGADAGAVADPAWTVAPRPGFGNAKRQVKDLPLLVEVGRLELRCAPLRHTRSGSYRCGDLRIQ
jgi:hypothetical protein